MRREYHVQKKPCKRSTMTQFSDAYSIQVIGQLAWMGLRFREILNVKTAIASRSTTTATRIDPISTQCFFAAKMRRIGALTPLNFAC
jgi:hypothetical protein